jgi:aminopeptidase-like protein
MKPEAVDPLLSVGATRTGELPGWIPLPDATRTGEEMYALARRLYPICRSITGSGVRQTLAVLRELIPLEMREVASGTPVFDWTVPKEWNIRDAYIKNSRGERVVDFQRSSLHVVNYSVPVRAKLRLPELRPHLHSLPEQPEWIPYRTSYYNESWGFCLAHKDLLTLSDDEYEVCIDSTLQPGSLSYGEYLVPGSTNEEVLIYTHTCHPSLANDNLSGIAVVTQLARLLAARRCRYSYRFVFGPGTIGSITWLSRNQERLHRIRHGLVVVLVGDPGPLTYKRSRYGNAAIDRAVQQVLRAGGRAHRVVDFSPYGYDERQFCSPGINLPVGRLTRTPNGEYPEYHTSADNLNLVRPDTLAESLEVCTQVLSVLENNVCLRSTQPNCEPQLGKRGLYGRTGGGKEVGQREYSLLWVLNLADGRHRLLDMIERSGLDPEPLYQASRDLLEAGLLEIVPESEEKEL